MKLSNAAVFPVLLMLEGCFHPVVINTGVKPGKERDHLLVFDAFGQGTAEVDVKCAKGLSSLSLGETIGQIFVRDLSMQIIYEKTARIVCAK
jgi:hypothetical protein